MKILIKQARIADPSSPFNGKTVAILVENGIISRIADTISEKADYEIQQEGLIASPGWVDVFANFADPGYEFKETLDTGAAAAAAGGFTDVFVIPNTNPALHNKAGIEYIRQRATQLPVNIHPIGAVTRNTEGKELAEMYDMQSSGAIAFSDGTHPIQSAGLLVKALQYVKTFDGVVIQLPDDRSIQPQGLMHEGLVSTQLGLPGKPALAEELIVERDIKLAAYAESRLHITGIASRKTVAYIRQGKENGVNITCSVTPYHLYFTEEDLRTYNTYLKVNPPIRSELDREALRQAVIDGVVDCIATHHLPHEYDSKILEFEYAKNGMTGLETAFAVLNTALPNLQVEKWAELLSANPRKLFNLAPATINEGLGASITLFDLHTRWTPQANTTKSRSVNNPFYGKELTGRVHGIINKQQLILN